ncbi:hypothetical protein FNF27_00111 [Cafeteria roenbergensis]|uniref:RIIa domain-containing protein n=2 Tax=Cafeteria roenbergensis TaxID=33653 RepID=A0A5A8CIQ8_CAFRO|nr:hypothetical protein FNF29_03436 [Cafeteria roenbergensis]KAA0178258.1 hypothetical protein FNF27_00111 [Cafeteria roenbergensis]|eukprot:KAA0152912.1 hypothetical protein FNF29_03436 [Cafeteria roenbergensis]
MADSQPPLSFEQVNQLKAKRADVEDGLRAWVGAHPELRRMMSDLVAAVLRDKPEDPVAFAKEWVAALDTAEA